MKVPFIRVGITLAVGSVVASAVRFYTAMGAAAADLESDVPTTGRGVRDWFVKDFLFQGSVPELLFWTGIAIAAVGIVVMAVRPMGGRREARANAAIAAAIGEYERERAGERARGGQNPGEEKW